MSKHQNPRPKRGWTNECYETKAHLLHKNGESAHCGKRAGFYEPLKVVSDFRQVTCERCKVAVKREELKRKVHSLEELAERLELVRGVSK